MGHACGCAFPRVFHEYGFGELSSLAQQRPEFIERVLPGLTIRDRCHIGGRFLWVQGDRGTYMPFEGEAMLSTILSKAFLLAADTKIKDPSIARQLP